MYARAEKKNWEGPKGWEMRAGCGRCLKIFQPHSVFIKLCLAPNISVSVVFGTREGRSFVDGTNSATLTVRGISESESRREEIEIESGWEINLKDVGACIQEILMEKVDHEEPWRRWSGNRGHNETFRHENSSCLALLFLKMNFRSLEIIILQLPTRNSEFEFSVLSDYFVFAVLSFSIIIS